MLSSRSEKIIKSRREILAVYTQIGQISWRRIYPETFYASDGFINAQESKYINSVYDIFQAIIDNHKKTIIEDEINLIYNEIESRSASGKFSEVALFAIQERMDLKKQVLKELEALTMEAESQFLALKKAPQHIRFRLESTTYLVRLLAYGLFSKNNMVFDRISEVFDAEKLQSATIFRNKQDMDHALRFLYKGLIQKNESGRQGNRHAARQTLAMLKEWYPDNEYVIKCIDKLEKYV